MTCITIEMQLIVFWAIRHLKTLKKLTFLNLDPNTIADLNHNQNCCLIGFDQLKTLL